MAVESWAAAGVAAFDAAAPAGPLAIHAQVMAAPTECPACSAEYTSDPETWLAAICYPPTEDQPVAGHTVDIPAWCATRQAFVWLNDAGEVEADR